jgi:hypothetical protein
MSDQRPTKGDLEKLSRRGMVCFAIRCAMREMYVMQCPPSFHTKTLVCIEAASRVCFAPDAKSADKAAFAAGTTISSYCNVFDTAAFAVRTAAFATDTSDDTTKVFGAAACAAFAACAIYADDADGTLSTFADANTKAATRAAVRTDYEKLLKLTGHQAGELGDPINPSEDGPLGKLWPETE